MTWGLEEATVRYGNRVALWHVTLEVRPGEVTAVVGGDGAGKTSALRVMVGALRPSGGSVRRPGREAIGYVPGSSGVYPDLTARENLAFAGAAFGIRGAALHERLDPLLDRTGLAEAADRLGGKLSGGMRHKLALAMALLHRPALLALDEPTTGVDPVSRAELWRLVGRAAAEGAAVLFSTTYLDEAERAASVTVLEAGRALLCGTPREVVEAVPGAVFESASRPDRGASWRRGARWRVWSPDGSPPPEASRVPIDLEDAVTVAALAGPEGGGQ